MNFSKHVFEIPSQELYFILFPCWTVVLLEANGPTSGTFCLLVSAMAATEQDATGRLFAVKTATERRVTGRLCWRNTSATLEDTLTWRFDEFCIWIWILNQYNIKIDRIRHVFPIAYPWQWSRPCFGLAKLDLWKKRVLEDASNGNEEQAGLPHAANHQTFQPLHVILNSKHPTSSNDCSIFSVSSKKKTGASDNIWGCCQSPDRMHIFCTCQSL